MRPGMIRKATPSNTATAAPEPERHPLLDAIDALQPDSLSPKEALEALYRLKKLGDES